MRTQTIRWKKEGPSVIRAELTDQRGRTVRADVFRWSSSRSEPEPWTFTLTVAGRVVFDGDEPYRKQVDAKLAAADELAELAFGFSDSGWLDPLRYDGDGYAAWLRELRTTRGVYAVRTIAGRVCYVGSSRRGRLYSTITRHFQEWSNDYASAGWTASAEGKEVRVWTLGDVDRTSRRIDSEAERLVLTKERELIRQLAPAINIAGAGDDLDDGPVPF